LTFLRIAGPAGSLTHDLAIDASGLGDPSPRRAGLNFKPAAFIPPDITGPSSKHHGVPGVVSWMVLLAVVASLTVAVRARGARGA